MSIVYLIGLCSKRFRIWYVESRRFPLWGIEQYARDCGFRIGMTDHAGFHKAEVDAVFAALLEHRRLAIMPPFIPKQYAKSTRTKTDADGGETGVR